MSMLTQIRAVTWMNLTSIPQRLGTSSVIVVGIAGVVAVLISVLAMATGFNRTIIATGRDDRAIVLRGGSDSELASTLSREATLTIMDAPGIRKDSTGKPIASAEAVVIVDMPKKSNDSGANVTIRGVGAQAMALRPEIKLTAGRMFQRGLRELIVGLGAQAQFKGLDVGSHIALRGSDWTIVGAFASNGDSHESELLADGETVLSAYRRNLYQSVVVLLDSKESFAAFKNSLTTNPQLSVDVMREHDYYAHQSQRMSNVLSFIAYVVGGIMAVGALFGALNTMYSAVSVRSREIATLRAIGFGASAVVLSVLIEAMLLSVIGALIGAGLAWIFFNGNVVSTLGSNFTQVVFRLAVSPSLVVLGIIWACVIGLVGGLFPAIRAARLPVATALRAV
ncbi:MAG TPA: ABC transporter permease [Steroidobacteraceae bacterium]|jgi:putative ABC transport system permease protein